MQMSIKKLYASQTVRYAATGVLNTTTDFVLFLVATYALNLPLLVANILAWLAAVSQSYVINKNWTFADSQKKNTRFQWLFFLLTNGAGLVISSVIVLTLAQYVTAIGAKAIATVVVFCWGYLISKKYIF